MKIKFIGSTALPKRIPYIYFFMPGSGGAAGGKKEKPIVVQIKSDKFQWRIADNTRWYQNLCTALVFIHIR